jgi:hypothetical protein
MSRIAVAGIASIGPLFELLWKKFLDASDLGGLSSETFGLFVKEIAVEFAELCFCEERY